MFAIVNFPQQEDTFDVVPLSWVTADEKYCMWPPGSADVQHMVLDEAVPGTTDEGWRAYPARVVARCRTYHGAQAKAKKYEKGMAMSGPEEQLRGAESPELQLPSPHLLLRTIRLLVEVRQEQRQGFNSLSAQMRHLSTRLDRIEGILEKRGQPVPPAAPIRDLPPLPATSLQELEAAEAALEDKDVAGALFCSSGTIWLGWGARASEKSLFML
ncbi:hypothetical protein HPB52_025625 [Rhipicephalus sanguineus]|uniref:Uncharacterized protein n=1 Tax=Rhipicephalus sanguineus TaxID=34632 RepID=A0A9D4SM75_RHISA|nr:hypothetical protein HPB52_025625 [Rhipicephalus sanguineus]